MMRGNALIAFGASILGAAVASSLDLGEALGPAWAGWALAVPLPAILLSSAVDWYVVLAFRDGVEGVPACRLEEVGLARRRRYTKVWVAHRLACEAAIAVALVLAAVGISRNYSANLEEIGQAVGFLGGVGIVVALLARRWILGGLRFCLRQGPALANWVSGRDGNGTNRRGFVRDVSLDNGVKLVASPDGDERFIPLLRAVPDISKARTDHGCAPGNCKEWWRVGSEITCEVWLQAAEDLDRSAE